MQTGFREEQAMKHVGALMTAAVLSAGVVIPDVTPSPGQTPLSMGRSVGVGSYCTTPAGTCALYEPLLIGRGCSCMLEGGRAGGVVSQ